MTAVPYQREDAALVTELVLRAQSGDGVAFGKLVERFQRAVYANALRRMRNHAEAEELTQDVFLKAFTKIGQLREPQAFGGWLRQITTRMAINRIVRRPHDAPVEPDLLCNTLMEKGNPFEDVLDGERAEQVRAGIDRLGDLDQATLRAFYFDGHSIVEMADEFDAPVGTIKRRLHVARKRLAELVADMMAV